MNQYIHFTSFENLNSMLESKTLRLYHYESFSDIHELQLPLFAVIQLLANLIDDEVNYQILLAYTLPYFQNIIKSKNYDINFSFLKNKISNYSDFELNYNKAFKQTKNTNLYLYIISFCKMKSNNFKFHFKHNLLANLESNTMWDYYGNKHTGVGIVFQSHDLKYLTQVSSYIESQFLNKPLKYSDAIDEIGLTIYNENDNIVLKKKQQKEIELFTSSIEDVKNILKEVNELSKFDFQNYKESIYINSIFKEFIDLVIEGVVFFKENKYKHENEHRLIYNLKEQNFDNVKVDSKKNSSYIELDFQKILKVNSLSVVLGEKNPLQTNVSLRYLYEQKYNLKFLNIIE